MFGPYSPARLSASDSARPSLDVRRIDMTSSIDFECQSSCLTTEELDSSAPSILHRIREGYFILARHVINRRSHLVNPSGPCMEERAIIEFGNDGSTVHELTLRALVIGVILGALLTAANTYLGH